ncbi:MAG: GIY-YIG nuclease family protein [bacterium]
MYAVYVLKSSDNKLYKGVTNDLVRRLQEHNSGQIKTTASMNKLELVYTETYNTFVEARKREVYLKTAAGRRFLKKILNK